MQQTLRSLALSLVLLTQSVQTSGAEAIAATPADENRDAMGPAPGVRATVDSRGAVHLSAITVPLSSLSSAEAQKNFLNFIHGFESLSDTPGSRNIDAIRKRLDDSLMRPGVEKLRAVFPVDIRPKAIAGVQTDVIEPAGGIADKNKKRVLINLHGGGFAVAAGLGGQMESIPIASLGAIKVITIDYREGPEYKFPAASEDVADVYRELLKLYPAENIGIYGCSAGGTLAAESLAWFQTHDLPRPGAVGMFGSGAMVRELGDSAFTGYLLMGGTIGSENPNESALTPYFDAPELNIKDPLVSPVYSSSVLSKFPPSLLISGTRDVALSSAAYTHAQLIKLGVPSDLHVWEGAVHCSYAQPIVDPSVPETREAWDVIVKFFDQHLGR